MVRRCKVQATKSWWIYTLENCPHGSHKGHSGLNTSSSSGNERRHTWRIWELYWTLIPLKENMITVNDQRIYWKPQHEWGEGLIRLLWVDSLNPARKSSCKCSKGRVGRLCLYCESRLNVFWTRLWHSNTRKNRIGSKRHLIRLHQP